MTAPEDIPVLNGSAFVCPICNAYARQVFGMMFFQHPRQGQQQVVNASVSQCDHCNRESFWFGGQLVYPDKIIVPPPNTDLDEDIQTDYLEAAGILSRSPRGSAAILRLCVQKLCKQLGEGGKTINNDIASLVEKGLPVRVQQALDIVRVIGNDAVHPGQIDITDDVDTARHLFRLVNLIAQNQITDPREAQELFDTLPEDKRQAIEKRDSTKKT